MLKRLNNRILWFLLGVIIILAFFGVFYIQNALGAVEPASKEQEKIVMIPSGSTTKSIAELLYTNELIKDQLVFQYYIKWKKVGSQLQAGKYSFSKGMTVEEIVQNLTMGKTIVESNRFTIPEGYTVEQIAHHLDQQGIANKERFLELAKLDKTEEFAFNFLQEPMKIPAVEYKIEGYLFPNTYEVKKDASEKEIINLLLQQFEQEWKKEWDQVLTENKLTLHQILTIAALVEREATVNQERPIIAGVIYNRMKENMNLQIDATIQYILGEQKARLMFDDLKIDHPYNTYIHSGLPPGPIANPGIDSIKAALFPDDNPYFYYVTKKDGTGEHFFARTYEEHLANIAKSKQTNK